MTRHSRAHTVSVRHTWIQRRWRRNAYWIEDLLRFETDGQPWWVPGRLAKWNGSCGCPSCRARRAERKFRARRALERRVLAQLAADVA